MTEKFTLTGEWFLPASKDVRVHGTLTFDPQNRIHLKVYGSPDGDSFSALFEFKNYEIILGITSDSKQVTLCNCSMTKSQGYASIIGQETGKNPITYSVSYMLIGIHADLPDDLKFTQISSEIFNLDEWVDINGFITINPEEVLKDGKITIEYKRPKPIEFKIDSESKGSFCFMTNPTELSYEKTATISQRVEFQVISAKEKSAEDLLMYTIRFQHFLTLARYRSTYPLSISLKGEKYKEVFGKGQIYKKVNLYFSLRNFTNDEILLSSYQMLFHYKRIASDFQQIIKNWYAKYELLRPAFNLVFEQFYNRKTFTINTFLNLAQSAETLHARVHNHTKMPREEYKKMQRDILASVCEKYHVWLKEQLNYGNNLNLHARLTELTEKYSNKTLDELLGDKSQFVKDVKHSRNYYTHYSKKEEKTALQGEELFYLSEKIKLLMVCAFLLEAGFEKEKLSESLENVQYSFVNHLVKRRNQEKKLSK